MTEQGKRLPPILAWIPWWLSVILAIASYVCLKYLPVHLAAGHPAYQPLAGFLPQLAPLAAIGFLLLAAVLLYDGDEPGQSEEPQEEPEGRKTDGDEGSSDTHEDH